MLEKPSPKAKAWTTTCRDTPARSPRGARIGMRRKAFAAAEPMKKFIARVKT